MQTTSKQPQIDEAMKDVKLLLSTRKHFAFFGSLLYHLKIKETKDKPHTYLDGLNSTIYVNPDWFLEISPNEQLSAIAHNVLHYALQHDIRSGSKSHIEYQNACDEVVNNLLKDYEFPLPIEPEQKFKNKSVEQIYETLKVKHYEPPSYNPPNNPNSNWGDKWCKDDLNLDNSSGFGSSGSSGSNEGQPQDTPQSHINERNKQLLEACTASEAMEGSKSIGNSSEAFKTLFEEIEQGKLDWRVILAEYLTELMRGDRDFSKFDRRMLYMGIYMPAIDNTPCTERVAIALDVSSSVSPKTIKEFLKEVRLIINILEPEEVDIVTFNTKIVENFKFKKHEDFSDIDLDIYGGTSLYPVFDHYNKPENKPEYLIVFSDLEVTIPKEKPDYHVIWCCYDNPNFDKSQITYGKFNYVEEYE